VKLTKSVTSINIPFFDNVNEFRNELTLSKLAKAKYRDKGKIIGLK